MTVKVERASDKDLRLFFTMEQETDTRDFITPYSYPEHLSRFSDPDLIYLRILWNKNLVGFFILALEGDGNSVEFRRIVVSTKDKGIGQAAIKQMEEFCRNDLERNRIWLDVFEYNHRGRHIYEKLGYRRFSEGVSNGRSLLLYEKQL